MKILFIPLYVNVREKDGSISLDGKFVCKLFEKLLVLADEASEGGNTSEDWWQVDLAAKSGSEGGDTNL